MKNKLNRPLAAFLISILFMFSEPVCSENMQRSEIMTFVGTSIPPAMPGRKSGRLLGWHTLNGFSVNNTTKLSLVIEDGYTENEFGFVVGALDKDLRLTIIDAKVIPYSLRRYDVNGGKAVERRDFNKIYDVANCTKDDANYPIIGLMHPERDCLHHSQLVKMAWRVNEDTRKLEEIPTKGISCFYPNAEDECN